MKSKYSLLLIPLLWCAAAAQVPVAIAPSPHPQFLTSSGLPLSGGFLYSYIAGTTTLSNTYADSTGTVQNPDPIPLDVSGAPSNGTAQTGIWLSNQAFKFCAYNSSMVQQWCTDNVTSYFQILNFANTWTFPQTFTSTITDTLTDNQIIIGSPGVQTTLDFPPPLASMTLHFPNTADTIIGRNTTDLLSNKSFTSAAVINSGVFNNAQSNLYLTAQVGGTTFAGTGLPNETDAITGVTTLPVGATVHQGNGLTGVCYSNAVSSPLGSNASCVGVFAVGSALVNNSASWGANFGSSAAAGTSGTLVMGNEVDLGLVATSAPNRFQGFFVTGQPLSGTMPTGPVMGTLNVASNSASAYGVAFPLGPSHFPVAFWSARGTAPVGLMLDANCYVGACASQSIELGGNDGSNANTVTMTADSTGHLVITAPTGVGVKLPQSTFANLNPSEPNGSLLFCTDCKNVADDTSGTFDSVAAGGGHGTNVLRENNVWRVH